MEYEAPALVELSIAAQEVMSDADTASSCNSSCCFTRESESW